MSGHPLKDFLELSYEELEEFNLQAKSRQLAHTSDDELRQHYLEYLEQEKRIKAVTVCFSDLEGRLHMLDYDKKFLIGSYENLTFDGSSVRGYSVVSESDLRLEIDWGSLRLLPADVFGPGKVVVFGLIKNHDGSQYPSDLRGRLKELTNGIWEKDRTVAYAAVEAEGFLFEGANAEQLYVENGGFEMVSIGGYYHSLPNDPLRLFIDAFAEAQRAMGFQNEKDHPEVAPSQFELNYSYTDALIAADQIQLYKLLARQIASNMGMTASFLPKPVANINGNGMHLNLSLAREGVNLFYDAKGENNLSKAGWDFIDRVLNGANDICLAMNASVNAYRRLDPDFEAPNQIKTSAVDRTSMVRIPLANEKSARIEVRTVAPDANPYLVIFSVLTTGLNGSVKKSLLKETRETAEYLPASIYEALEHFNGSSMMKEILGADVHEKYSELKCAAADRSPKELGVNIKEGEILFHHEVCNQFIWGNF